MISQELANFRFMGMTAAGLQASPLPGGARVNEMSPLLIVDDEPEYLDEILEALAYEGIEAVSASNGAAAVAMLRKYPDIRVVVTDIRMPEMDGIAFVEAARGEFGNRDLHFIVVTGHAAKSDLERARAAGVRNCLSKPLALDDLRRAIQSLQV